MTKAQREKAERLMLKHLIDTRPKYKEIMDALIDNPNNELKDVIQPVIEEELKKARMIGVNIGYYGALLRIYEDIKDMKNIEEIKKFLLDKANEIKLKYKI